MGSLLWQLWRTAVWVFWVVLSPLLWIWRRVRAWLPPRPAWLPALRLPCTLIYDPPENQQQLFQEVPAAQPTKGQEILQWCLGIFQWCLMYIRLFFWSIDLIPVRDFGVCVRTTGNTHACERQFLKDVSKHLFWDVVFLNVNTMAETSRDLLLLFCPIASRMGSDIENALEGLNGRPRALLVAMHYVQKDNTWTFVDVLPQGARGTAVPTVHARYTQQDGLYDCEMNKAAVADVATAIKGLVGRP